MHMKRYEEEKIREMIREEIREILTKGGIALISESPKKGNKVRTIHGIGRVIAVNGEQVRVELDSGAVMKVHRDRATVIG